MELQIMPPDPPLPPPLELLTPDNRATVRQYGIIKDRYVRMIKYGPIFLTDFGRHNSDISWESVDGLQSGKTGEDKLIEWTEDAHVGGFDPNGLTLLILDGGFPLGTKVKMAPRRPLSPGERPHYIPNDEIGEIKGGPYIIPYPVYDPTAADFDFYVLKPYPAYFVKFRTIDDEQLLALNELMVIPENRERRMTNSRTSPEPGGGGGGGGGAARGGKRRTRRTKRRR